MRASVSLLALIISTAVSSGAALAQSCGRGPFSGAYIGATLGAARLNADQLPAFETKITTNDWGTALGVLAGYNLQCGQLVLGAETDINYVGLETNATQTGSWYRTNVDWFGSVRGRLGVTLRNDLMAYATAGWGYAQRSHRFEDNTFGLFVDTSKNIANGFIYGGGIEMLHAGRHMLRFEALYVDLGKESRTYTIPAVATTSADWKDSFFVARLGWSIKFGEPERAHQPLK